MHDEAKMRILFSSQKNIYEKNQTTVDFSFYYVDKLTRSIKYHKKVENDVINICTSVNMENTQLGSRMQFV